MDRTREGSYECDFCEEQLIDSKDPIFDGHYPHLPIYPGSMLVDRIERAVQSHAATFGVDLCLVKINRVNFHYPVFPGAKIELKCSGERTAVNMLRVNVQVTSGRAIATARMEFEVVHAN